MAGADDAGVGDEVPAAARAAVPVDATDFGLTTVSDDESWFAAITLRSSVLSWARISGVDGFASRLQAAAAERASAPKQRRNFLS
jgi:hypothetical protein